MGGDEAAELLSGLALFADLSPPQLEAAAHTFEEESFSPGQRVLRQGLGGGNFYVIVEGEAVVRIDGRELPGRLGRGDFFGEISILTGRPPSADVVAVGPLRCLVLPGPGLRDFLVSHPTVAYRMLRVEAERVRGGTGRVEG